MAEEIASFLEKELLNGTASKATGALSTTTGLTAAAAAAITADELIDLQAKVKQVYQNGACWTMHPDTFTAIKKLKDANNRYLLQDDVTGEFPYRLLGKPVYLSDNMPVMAAGAKAVSYTHLDVYKRQGKRPRHRDSDAGRAGADEGGMGCISERRRWIYRKMLNVRYGNAMDEPVCCADPRLLHRMRTILPLSLIHI